MKDITSAYQQIIRLDSLVIHVVKILVNNKFITRNPMSNVEVN